MEIQTVLTSATVTPRARCIPTLLMKRGCGTAAVLGRSVIPVVLYGCQLDISFIYGVSKIASSRQSPQSSSAVCVAFQSALISASDVAMRASSTVVEDLRSSGLFRHLIRRLLLGHVRLIVACLGPKVVEVGKLQPSALEPE